MASQDTFSLVIASVGETRFDGRALSVTFPGASGDFTVLAHHQPFVTTLKSGVIRVRESGEATKEFIIENGVLEVAGNRAVVLL